VRCADICRRHRRDLEMSLNRTTIANDETGEIEHRSAISPNSSRYDH
jgi:hypothetical protein